ncbi:MAG: alpha/beta fold hydrolase [bacterium]|nr:alpha/beta fold hydrolase [bacterium]
MNGAASHRESVPVEGLEAVNGTELWVKRMGSGEPIVVVHGGPVLEHGYLLPHLAPLAEHYELVFFDQRLSGRSAPEVEESSVRLANLAEDIEALRKALGLKRIHLMGHSWGGLLAMHYAVRYESNLSSLVLLDTMAASAALWRQEQGILGEMMTDELRAERQAILVTEAFAERRPEAIEKLLKLSFKTQFHDPAKLARLELYVPEDYMARSQLFDKLGADLESFDLHEELKSLMVPALVLFGDAEPGAVLGGAAIHKALPASEFVLIEDAGHFPFIEQQEAVLGAIVEFLREVEAVATAE